MKLKQVTTITYIHEAKLTKNEAQKYTNMPKSTIDATMKSLNQDWRKDLLIMLGRKLNEHEKINVETEIEVEA